MNPPSTSSPAQNYSALVAKALKTVKDKLFGDDVFALNADDIGSFKDLEAALLVRDPAAILRHTCDDSVFCALANTVQNARQITRHLFSVIGAFAEQSDLRKLSEFRVSEKTYGKHAQLFRDTIARQLQRTKRADDKIIRDIHEATHNKPSLFDLFEAVGYDPQKCADLLKCSNESPIKLLTIRNKCALWHGMPLSSPDFKELGETGKTTPAVARRNLKGRVLAQKKAARKKKQQQKEMDAACGLFEFDDDSLSWNASDDAVIDVAEPHVGLPDLDSSEFDINDDDISLIF